jgi:spore maturation protein CgeB
MRIFSAVRHSNDPQYYYGALWKSNFSPALTQLGHHIIESQVNLLPASRFMHIPGEFTPEELAVRRAITERIIEEVQNAHRDQPIDLFLSYFYNAHFDPAGFDELRRLKIPSVNFYCNSMYQFSLVKDIASKANFSWHPEKSARSLYLKAGANPVWVQMGADPDIYHPLPNSKRKQSACFIGQRYADRDRWMAALIQKNIPVDIYGPGWGMTGPSSELQKKNCSSEYLGRRQPRPGSSASYFKAARGMISEHGVIAGISRALRQMRYRGDTRRISPLFVPHAKGAIPYDRIAEVFAAHEVCLNFSNVWEDGRPGSALIPHVRLRDFEGPMCRTCYLTGHTEEIAEFYEVGKEIDTYQSEQELVDKTRFYLKNPGAAERIRQLGYKRALRDHTWKQRFEDLFSKLDISDAGQPF